MEQDGASGEEHSGHSGQDNPGATGIPGTERPEVPGLVEALRMLDERDRTIMELAGRVGYLQAELTQAREQLALMAPASPEPAPAAEATPAPATRPWWRRVWRAVQV